MKIYKYLMHSFMVILAFLLCFKMSVADEIKDIEVLDELPASLVKYRDYPWVPLKKTPKFMKKFRKVLKNSSEEMWVKEMIIVAGVGQSYLVDNHIVFCYEGNKPHGGENMLRIIYDPVKNNMLLSKRVYKASFVPNYSSRMISSILYGDKYDYLMKLLSENVDCRR